MRVQVHKQVQVFHLELDPALELRFVTEII